MKTSVLICLFMVSCLSFAENSKLEIFNCHYQRLGSNSKSGNVTLSSENDQLLLELDGSVISGPVEVSPILALSPEEKNELEDQAAQLPEGAFGFDIRDVVFWQLVKGNNSGFPVGLIKVFGKGDSGGQFFLGWMGLAVGFFAPCNPSK